MSVNKDSYGEEIFPFGAMYAPVARATEVPVSEWESDIVRMKELGFTIIRSWAAWDRIERVEGQRDFEKLDYVFQLAEKNDLKITLFIGGAFSSLMGCYPPVWLRNRCQRQTEVTRERDAELSLCFDDPLYRDKAEDFLRELIDRYASHPALHSWIVWGEPAWNGCRCPKTVAAYRKWLQSRYDTLALLNEAWSSEAPHHYDRWEDVQPVSCGYAPSIDWHRFCEDHLNEVIGWISKLVKQGSPDKPTITYPCPWELDARALGNKSNFWDVANVVDILGMSHYVFQYPHRSQRPDIPACYLDRVRSAAADKPYWIMENQAGPCLWTFTPPQEVSLDRNRLLHAQMLAHGAKGILSWMYRSRISDNQAGEFGLVARDGSMTERALAASRFANFVKDNAVLLSRITYLSDVAILSAHSTMRLTGVEHAVDEHGQNYWQQSWLGAYRLMWDLHCQADFLDDSHIIAGRLSRYKVLLLPFRINITPAIANRIEEFVREGGWVIADFSLGMKNDEGILNTVAPGCGLGRIFGYSSVDASPICDREITFIGGEVIPTHIFQQVLAPLPSADVIGNFTSGAPAAISNEYGHGGAIMIASMFFAQYEKTGDSASSALMQRWLNECGVCNSVQIVCPADDHAADRVEVCKLESEDEREEVVLYVLNHNEVKVNLSCTLSPELTRSRQSVNDLCGNTCIKLHHSTDGFARFALSLEAQEFAVLVFT